MSFSSAGQILELPIIIETTHFHSTQLSHPPRAATSFHFLCSLGSKLDPLKRKTVKNYFRLHEKIIIKMQSSALNHSLVENGENSSAY